MAPRAIISYDDTPGDHDALMLGRILADAGASLTLAYVRHCACEDCSQEELEEHEAEALLERGAERLADLEVDTRVMISPSTPEGLRQLIEERRADIVVFGSDYRTPPGRVSPQHTTQSLLECGPAAVAIAPSDYFGGRVHRIGVLAIPGDDTTLATARAPAAPPARPPRRAAAARRAAPRRPTSIARHARRPPDGVTWCGRGGSITRHAGAAGRGVTRYGRRIRGT